MGGCGRDDTAAARARPRRGRALRGRGNGASVRAQGRCATLGRVAQLTTARRAGTKSAASPLLYPRPLPPGRRPERHRPVIATSFRARLILAFSVLVGLVLFVGVVSYGINQQVRSNVDELRPGDRVDISGIDTERQGLEFEGYWNPAGAFIATQVTAEPEPLKPKLRGPIQDVSAKDRTITMYGRTIQITDDTDGDDSPGGARPKPLDFKALDRGVRAEVSCKVENGQWIARQIQLNDIKSSNKVKGMVTRLEQDGVPPERAWIHDLEIVLQPVKESGPESAFGRIEHGTEMLRALQKFRAEAHHAVDLHAESDAQADIAARPEAAPEMERQAARFEQQLLDARRAGSDPAMIPAQEFLNYLDSMTRNVGVLMRHVRELQQLIHDGPPARALNYLSDDLEGYLDAALLPYVYAYLNKAEEELGDQLHGVLDRTGATTRVALITSVVAVAVAIVLGAMVWRSIHRPIRQLHAAAVALGEGRLDTRVGFRSGDELGVLAGAFERMTAQLAASTGWVASMQHMFDAMAAGVLLCDGNGIVTTVNRAARDLVARTSGELVGKPFAAVCRLGPGERLASMVLASTAAGGSMERRFVRKDGSELPVSLSIAEMRSPTQALQGYVVVAQDLTPIKHIEGQLRESLAEKELLLREVHHRVKNNMQVNSSLLEMQSTSDPEVRQRLEESQHRIRTIALIHEQLYQSTELAQIDTRSYLNVLATHLLQSFGKADRVRLEFDVEPMDLDLDQSLACGLIVNELLTNALKYAFPDDRRGTIRLVLKNMADGSRLLEVADDGRGIAPPDPAAPRRTTLGTSLVAKLARQLRGKVEIDGSNGMCVRIRFGGRLAAEAVTP